MLQSLPVAYRRDAWVIALLGAVQAVDDGQRHAKLPTSCFSTP